MFCRNCGKPVEGDQELCSICAAELNAPSHEAPVQAEQPVQAPQTQEAPAPAPDTFVLSTADSAAPKKAPKKRGGLIAAIVALVVVAAAAVGILTNLGRVNAFVARTFQSPEEYLNNVESEAIAEYSAELTQSYGKVLNAYNEDLTASEAEIRLTLGDSILSLAETALRQQGMDMDMDWLQEIKLSVNANVQDDAMQMGMGIGLGKNDVLSADVIVDMEGGKAYFAVPELNKNYLFADISYALSAAEFNDMISQSTQMYNDLVKALPSEEDLNSLINSYVGIILSGIKNVDKQQETVTVSGVSQKMVVLTAKIKEADMIDMAIDVLEKAEKDKSLQKVFTAMSDYVNEMGAQYGYYYEPMDLYQEFIDSIPYLLQNLEDMKEYANNGNYVKLRIYVDMEGHVRGHKLTVYSDGEKYMEPFSWLTVVKGDTTYIKGEIDTVVISGEKTEKKGVSSGSYTLTVDDMKIGTLKFSNVTENSGTLRLTPSEEVLNELLYSSGIPTAMLGEEFSLEVSYSSKGSNDFSYEVNILVDSDIMIGFAMSLETSSGGKISIPANAMSVDDQEAVMAWVMEMDVENILTALERADFPQDLLDIARSYLSMLQYY